MTDDTCFITIVESILSKSTQSALHNAPIFSYKRKISLDEIEITFANAGVLAWESKNRLGVRSGISDSGIENASFRNGHPSAIGQASNRRDSPRIFATCMNQLSLYQIISKSFSRVARWSRRVRAADLSPFRSTPGRAFAGPRIRAMSTRKRPGIRI